ncbi:MAG: hypothetical protein ACOX7F_02825 [Eubacteriales bacterium]|jgi:hypothetical protein
MHLTDKNSKTTLGLGISLIVTTVTALAAVAYALYKVFNVLNKISYALDLYIEDHEFLDDDEDEYYPDEDDGYINCACCADDTEDTDADPA